MPNSIGTQRIVLAGVFSIGRRWSYCRQGHCHFSTVLRGCCVSCVKLSKPTWMDRPTETAKPHIKADRIVISSQDPVAFCCVRIKITI